MRWKQMAGMPEKKPKKDGWIVKPQYAGNILVLDLYTDREWEARYCIDRETGEHGYQTPGGRWKRSKLITCAGGDPQQSYMYYSSNYVSLNDLEFESKDEREAVETFLERGRYGYWHERIECLEMEYDRNMRWDAEDRKRQRERDFMSQIPDAPRDLREWIYEKENAEEYIFFDKETGMWGCSCCGAKTKDKALKRLPDGGKVRHNDRTTCPKCGRMLTAKKRNKQMQKKTGIYLICPVNAEASVIRYMDAKITWEYGRHAVELDEEIRIVAYKIGVNPRRKRNVQLYYNDGWRNFGTANLKNKKAKAGYLYPGIYKDALDNTLYADGIRVLEQLAAAGKKLNYNQALIGIGALKNYECVLEYLFKGRFERMLEETVDKIDWWSRGTYYGKLNLMGNTLEEVFGIDDRQKINRIREENGGEKMLEWMRYSEETGKKIPKDTLQYMIRNEIKPLDCKLYLPEMSPQKIQNYLEKQRAAGYKNLKQKEILEQWEDYLSMCRAMGKNMEDEMVYKPRDLKLRHDQAAADENQMKIVKAMQENKEFRETQAKEMREKYPEAEKNLNAIRERYEFQNGEYTILVPHDLVEIIEDGQALHHCAGASERYFDRIESKETYICFLRRTETPSIPFYTIEVEPSGTIRQHRSYLDEEPGIEEIRGFLKEWQKTLKKRLTEEDKRLAKISREKREQNIRELEEKNNTRVLRGLAEDFMENILDFEEIA